MCGKEPTRRRSLGYPSRTPASPDARSCAWPKSVDQDRNHCRLYAFHAPSEPKSRSLLEQVSILPASYPPRYRRSLSARASVKMIFSSISSSLFLSTLLAIHLLFSLFVFLALRGYIACFILFHLCGQEHIDLVLHG